MINQLNSIILEGAMVSYNDGHGYIEHQKTNKVDGKNFTKVEVFPIYIPKGEVRETYEKNFSRGKVARFVGSLACGYMDIDGIKLNGTKICIEHIDYTKNRMKIKSKNY